MESIRFISETHVLAQPEPTDGSRHGGCATQLQVTLSGNVSWHMSPTQVPLPTFPLGLELPVASHWSRQGEEGGGRTPARMQW